MPELNNNQIEILLKEYVKKATPISLQCGKEEIKKTEEECSEYIKNGNKNINDMNPLSVYFIISKLSENEQIEFIKRHITYIKKNDENVFLYTMLSPRSLSYFFSYNVLKELRNIDNEIFTKVISQNHENLFHGLTHEDYLNLCTDFYSELLKANNEVFFDILFYHNKWRYDSSNFSSQKIDNKNFICFLLEKYKEKINKFEYRDLLLFLNYIEDKDLYKEFINNHYEKLNIAFINASSAFLKNYLDKMDDDRQAILLSTFHENIIEKHDIEQIIYEIRPNIVINLYNKNKDLFSVLTLSKWIRYCCKYKIFNDDFRMILDTFKIENIEPLFDTKYLHKKNMKALEYIETKYRSSILINNVLEKIDISTSIFQEKYLKNLSELKEMFKCNIISRTSNCYKQHLSNFIFFLKSQKIVNNIDNNGFKEIEKLFYRIVMGKTITILYNISNIEEITLSNRLGKTEFNGTEFTVEQLENYNVKQHKQLYKKLENNNIYIRGYKVLILKLMFMVGFNNAKKILEIDDSLPTLEHLVGDVDVKNINLDRYGNPILNTKLMNLLFGTKDYSKIKEMLLNKNNDLYKYFPRIFNDWNLIEMNNKDKSLSIILEFLKSDEISLTPKYYRLEGIFKFVGCSGKIVDETLSLHDQMLKRVFSKIPRINGVKDDYSYEILKLDDMEALSVGNKTDCCFTVLGNGYSCLKHALTSYNGRIFVIKKNNEIMAHSWVWRNGDLLCFDNVEISKKINYVDFFDIYLQATDELIKTSFEFEGPNSCIKNITIGFTNFDKEILGIEKYPCLILKTCNLKDKDFDKRLGVNRMYVDALPQPIEEVDYSDSKNVQYLIRGNGIFNLGQSNFNYFDERKEIMYYSSTNLYDDQYLKIINKKINGLRYIKAEVNNELELYKPLNIEDLKEAYCNDDWYVIVYASDYVETFNSSLDKRANSEINSITLKHGKTLSKHF